MKLEDFICKHPEKRKPYPKWDQYSCYTTMSSGNWQLKNGLGEIIKEFFSEEEKNQQAQKMICEMMKEYREKRNDAAFFKEKHPEYYIPTFEEANWIHKAIYKGFTTLGELELRDLYDGWCGVKSIKPDLWLKREGKEIQVSFSGLLMDWSNDEKVIAIQNKHQCRFIKFIDNKETVYINWLGQIPSMEFILNFIA